MKIWWIILFSEQLLLFQCSSWFLYAYVSKRGKRELTGSVKYNGIYALKKRMCLAIAGFTCVHRILGNTRKTPNRCCPPPAFKIGVTFPIVTCHILLNRDGILRFARPNNSKVADGAFYVSSNIKIVDETQKATFFKFWRIALLLHCPRKTVPIFFRRKVIQI